MGIFADYKLYKKYEPEYDNWKKRKNLSEAKKLEYLKQNPIDDNVKRKEIQRGEALLHAIDVMDEYSQCRAENMEIATQQAVALFGQIASLIGMGVGFALNFLPPVKKGLQFIANRYPKTKSLVMFLPMGLGVVASMITTMCFQGWAASKEVGASRKGRFEAMKNELSNHKIFAVLNDEQKAKQKELVNKIPTTDKMKKGVFAEKSSMLNPKNLLKVVKDMISDDKKLEKERLDFNRSLYNQPDKNVELSAADILQAKKDQQLLHNVIEKIDTLSQEYAEKVEMTQVCGGIVLTSGGLGAFIAHVLMKLLKINVKIKQGKFIPAVVGVITAVGASIWAASIQKQASRVGRYLAKLEIEKNLDNFVYVDKEITDKLSDNVKVEKKKDENIFKFIVQIFKDNWEYNKYLKTRGVNTIKENIAMKDIELTPEQEKEAKILQKNTFKAFNKLDEKSQQYAESVEAVGEVINAPLATFSIFGGLGLGTLLSNIVSKSKMPNKNIITPILPLVGTLLGIIPTIVNNIYFTYKQIQASKVAHMLALNEMSDYKNYIDYENLIPDVKIKTSNKVKLPKLFEAFKK